jgi:hypothetical protein
MAAISDVFTIGYVAQMLERDEDLLWDPSDELEPEDGVLWVYDINDGQTRAFTLAGIVMLREMIKDQSDRTKSNLSGP